MTLIEVMGSLQQACPTILQLHRKLIVTQHKAQWHRNHSSCSGTDQHLTLMIITQLKICLANLIPRG